MSGGRLIQHQENPHYIHPITTIDGKEVLITSTHHQAMYPYDMNGADYTVIGWTKGVSRFHQNGHGQEINPQPFREVEICYFPGTKVLGIQGHPEIMDKKQHAATFEYLDQLLDNHLNDKL